MTSRAGAGRARQSQTMQVSQCSSWAAARVELDRKVGEAIDIYVNTRLVARGECGGRGSLGGP